MAETTIMMPPAVAGRFAQRPPRSGSSVRSRVPPGVGGCGCPPRPSSRAGSRSRAGSTTRRARSGSRTRPSSRTPGRPASRTPGRAGKRRPPPLAAAPGYGEANTPSDAIFDMSTPRGSTDKHFIGTPTADGIFSAFMGNDINTELDDGPPLDPDYDEASLALAQRRAQRRAAAAARRKTMEDETLGQQEKCDDAPESVRSESTRALSGSEQATAAESDDSQDSDDDASCSEDYESDFEDYDSEYDDESSEDEGEEFGDAGPDDATNVLPSAAA